MRVMRPAMRPSGRFASCSRRSPGACLWSSWWMTCIGRSRRFLDLLEHVADNSRDLPILLVGIARPDLLDSRLSWTKRGNATSIRIDPLNETECHELISNLLDRAPLPSAVESMIAGAAQGNALCAEELGAMLVDDGLLTRGEDRWVASSNLAKMPMPSTI